MARRPCVGLGLLATACVLLAGCGSGAPHSAHDAAAQFLTDLRDGRADRAWQAMFPSERASVDGTMIVASDGHAWHWVLGAPGVDAMRGGTCPGGWLSSGFFALVAMATPTLR